MALDVIQASGLRIKKGEKTYALHCDADCPLGEIHDVLMEMKGYILQRMNEQHEKDKKTVDKKSDIELVM